MVGAWSESAGSSDDVTRPAQIEAALSFSGHLSVVVRSADATLVTQVRQVFGAGQLPPLSSVRDEPTSVYEIDSPKPGLLKYTVWLDGVDVFEAGTGREVLWYLEGSITQLLNRRLTEFTLFHAGAVVYRGRTVLLPGASGSGKSTAVATLAMSGGEFYSDEIAVIDSSGRLCPYPRLIGLKQGGAGAIRSFFPLEMASGSVFKEALAPVTYVRPPNVPDLSERDRPRVDSIVLPRRAPDEEARLERVSRATAISALAAQSLDLKVKHRRAMDTIVRIAKGAQCYALTVSDVRGVLRAIDAEFAAQAALRS